MFYENASGERLRPQQVRLGSILRTTAKRTYEGAPGVVLGVLLITLDTISTGLLVFPPTQEDEAFGDLQVQGISLYIMSTIVSQLTLSLGGSGFEGAFGAMLTEVLPFLRAVASDIRQSVGDDSPRLIPTVVVAYAMTSILIGLCFLVMAALKLGWIVSANTSVVQS